MCSSLRSDFGKAWPPHGLRSIKIPLTSDQDISWERSKSRLLIFDVIVLVGLCADLLKDEGERWWERCKGGGNREGPRWRGIKDTRTGRATLPPARGAGSGGGRPWPPQPPRPPPRRGTRAAPMLTSMPPGGGARGRPVSDSSADSLAAGALRGVAHVPATAANAGSMTTSLSASPMHPSLDLTGGAGCPLVPPSGRGGRILTGRSRQVTAAAEERMAADTMQEENVGRPGCLGRVRRGGGEGLQQAAPLNTGRPAGWGRRDGRPRPRLGWWRRQ